MAGRHAPADLSVEDPSLSFVAEAGEVIATPAGDWTIRLAPKMEAILAQLIGVDGRRALRRKVAGEAKAFAAAKSIVVDLGAIGRLDTAGALLLNRLFVAAGDRLKIANLDDTKRTLIEAVAEGVKPAVAPLRRSYGALSALAHLGRLGISFAEDLGLALDILGGATIGIFRWLTLRSRFRFASYVTHLERTGMAAVPIIALMSFLIGGILAHQGAFYFRRFSADLYVVDLAGMLTLRELGVLLTAIMVAGRSGSAITAELGSMKMREEIDALRVLGLDPTEVLILPRILALITAVPILTFIADIAALLGAALDAAAFTNIPGEVFASRLREAVDLQTFFVGFSKAPFMALIIGLIATVEGFKVAGSAESLGQHTTMAVVKSIFFVVVVDGFFAIFFAAVGV
ncbi:MAG: ABC transporter permease [Ancalomicrobiaceae bacterium]|nr:ABC transporter permease [Ancalomicrobiaceae bacterium]